MPPKLRQQDRVTRLLHKYSGNEVKDKKAFIVDLKAIYQAPTREAAEGN
jgi:hypothetical protein